MAITYDTKKAEEILHTYKRTHSSTTEDRLKAAEHLLLVVGEVLVGAGLGAAIERLKTRVSRIPGTKFQVSLAPNIDGILISVFDEEGNYFPTQTAGIRYDAERNYFALIEPKPGMNAAARVIQDMLNAVEDAKTWKKKDVD